MASALALGPVIGKVTTTTARVLVDVARAATVKVTVQPPGTTAGKKTVTVTTTAAAPVRVAAFSGLIANTSYAVTITVDGVTDDRTGSFRTPATTQSRHELLVMSCCDGDHPTARDMHDLAYRRHVVTGSATIALHVGDQVYADKVYRGCVAGLIQQPRSKWPSFLGWIAEQYRSLYRHTWNLPGLRELLSSTMNLMIWDDHEVTDDWADRGLFADQTTAAAFVARCAWRVYREYQRQLWEDVEDPAGAALGRAEHHAHTWGWLGALFVDNRGGRAFQPTTGTNPYLGAEQWGRIRSLLTDTGTFKSVKVLVVATPVPLVFMGPRGTAMYDDRDDLWGHWSHDPYRAEQYKMLDALRTWKRAAPDRDVVLVGGDVHVGGLYTIFHRDHQLGPEHEIFRELIASPIRMAPLSPLEFTFYSAAVKGEDLLFYQSPTFSYRIDDLRRAENFGVITASLDGAGHPHTQLAIVDSDSTP